MGRRRVFGPGGTAGGRLFPGAGRVARVKKVSGTDDIAAYDAIARERVALHKDQEDGVPDNIVPFPNKLDPIAEFHINNYSSTKDDFDRISFVARALSRDKKVIEVSVFKGLIHVEIEGDRKLVVATDGRRLHTAEISLDLLPGNYTIRFAKDLIALRGPMKDDYCRYQDWRKVIPENSTERAIINFRGTGLSMKNLKATEEMSIKSISLSRKQTRLSI
jgi:hypothetical protein